MNLTPPAPPTRPLTPEPERTFTAPIRPIVINKPVERIERTFIEEPGPRTEPLPVVPPATPAPVVHVHVAPPTQAERTPDAPVPPPVAPRPEKERATHRPDPAQYAPTPPTDRAPVSRDPAKEFAPPNEKSSDPEQKGVPEPNEKSSPNNSERVPQTIPNNSQPELISPDKTPPQADVSGFKKVGKVGRQRRYDEVGIDDIEPIKEVFLFRHQMGRHWPGLSKDMIDYYEYFYFTKPNKRKDGKDYDKHVKCYERRERWLSVTPTS